MHLHILPILVWLGVVAALVGLFQRRWETFEVLGVASNLMCEVSSVSDGRLKSVSAGLFEKVDKGQTVAVLDSSHIRAALATASAQIEQLTAQLAPTQNRLIAEAENQQTDFVAAQRRFAADVESNRLRVLELTTLVETDLIVLEDLVLEVKIAEKLLREQAIAPYELEKAKVQYEAVVKRIQANRDLSRQAEKNLTKAEERLSEFTSRQPQSVSVDDELELIRKSIKVQEYIIEELLVEREALTLTAPVSGIVNRIDGLAGETAIAGLAIMTIEKIRPDEIIAYVSQQQSGYIKEGLDVEIVLQTNPPQVSKSKVTYVGSTIEQMPERLWQNPDVPQWGRPFLVKIPSQMKIAPGELVGIRRLEMKN